MDAFENENFFESIFKDWNQSFWYKRVSWKTAKRIFSYPVDAWHLSKSAMVICLVLSIVFFRWHPKNLLEDISLIAAYGILWNGGFWLFYNKLFRIK